MTMRLYIAPAGTEPGDGPGEGWTEIGAAVGDVDFTAQIEPDEPWVPMTTTRTFTASFAAPGLFAVVGAAIKAAEQRERELAAQRVLHLEAQRITDHRLRSVFELHPLGGGPWSYGEIGPPPAPNWIQSIIDGLSPDITTRRDRRRRGRGGP